MLCTSPWYLISGIMQRGQKQDSYSVTAAVKMALPLQVPRGQQLSCAWLSFTRHTWSFTPTPSCALVAQGVYNQLPEVLKNTWKRDAAPRMRAQPWWHAWSMKNTAICLWISTITLQSYPQKNRDSRRKKHSFPQAWIESRHWDHMVLKNNKEKKTTHQCTQPGP